MFRRFVLVLAVLAAGLLPTAPAIGAAPTPASAPGQLLVAYKQGVSEAAKQSARASVQATKLSTIVKGTGSQNEVELVRFPESMLMNAAIRAFEANPNVLYAEPNWILTTQATSNDPYYTGGSLWGMYGDLTSPKNTFGTHAGEAWANDKVGSKGSYIGIIDEGFDFNHPDLSANVWTNPYDAADGKDNDGNGFVDDIRGWDFINNDNTTYDGTSDDHGTHVAGTIGASGANATGVAGVSWNVTLISGKFLGTNGGSTSDAVRAVNYFTDLKIRHGLNIVATSNSWGGGGYSATLHQAIIKAAKADILFIAAAGNSTTNNDVTASYPSNYNSTVAAVSSGVTIEQPATYDNVIAVAAIASNGSIASFSSYGATTVDIGAPGVGIWSTLPGNTYGSYNGTSMATPHVSGAAALINASTGLTGSALRTEILANVTTYSALTGKVATNGRLDLSRFAGSTPVSDATAPTVSLSASATSVATGTPITLTATATDNVGVSKVEFYSGATLLSTDTTAPYTATFTAPSAATYSLTATAFDAANNSATSNTVSITATTATVATSVSATNIAIAFSGGRLNNSTLTATATVKNNLGTLVAGASVSVSITNTTTATTWRATGTTNSSGQAIFTLKNPPAGSYNVCVTGITAGSLTFSGSTCATATRP